MEAKIHKDVVLFKRILTHDKFDDHVEEVGGKTKIPVDSFSGDSI